MSPTFRKIRRLSDEAIMAVFGLEAVLIMMKAKGERFMPKIGRSLLFQIEYSIFAIGYSNYGPMKVDYRHEHLDFC